MKDEYSIHFILKYDSVQNASSIKKKRIITDTTHLFTNLIRVLFSRELSSETFISKEVMICKHAYKSDLNVTIISRSI